MRHLQRRQDVRRGPAGFVRGGRPPRRRHRLLRHHGRRRDRLQHRRLRRRPRRVEARRPLLLRLHPRPLPNDRHHFGHRDHLQVHLTVEVGYKVKLVK